MENVKYMISIKTINSLQHSVMLAKDTDPALLAGQELCTSDFKD